MPNQTFSIDAKGPLVESAADYEVRGIELSDLHAGDKVEADVTAYRLSNPAWNVTGLIKTGKPNYRSETAQELQAVAVKIVEEISAREYVKCGEDYYRGYRDHEIDRSLSSINVQKITLEHFTEYKNFKFLPVVVSDAISPAQRLNGIEWKGSESVSFTVKREMTMYYDHQSAWTAWTDETGSGNLSLTKKNGVWTVRGFNRETPAPWDIDHGAVDIDFTFGNNPKIACLVLQKESSQLFE